MRLMDFTARLKGVKGSGSKYAALCPAHEDRNPSLSISEQEGKILLHCHAGCTAEGIVAAMGLEMKDLFVSESPALIARSKREIAAVYDYMDLDGTVVHSTVRYSPKGFSQRRPDPARPGEYIWKDVFKGITPILYNLQAVVKAVEEKRPVFIVEGEKDCENLEGLGFTATTCPMGAGKWRGEYSEILKGAVVYIIADLDEAGSKHAGSVARSLSGKASGIYTADLAAAKPESMTELPRGWDVSDLIEATPPEKQKGVVAELAADATEYGAYDEEPGADGSPGGKMCAAGHLLKLVEASGAAFFHSDVKDLYATIPVGSHAEVLPIGSRDFELWLNGLFYRSTGKPISKDGVKQALAVLSVKALYDSPEPVKLSVRVTEHEGAFWYDLTNSKWQAVRINGWGWGVIDNPPVLFTRYRHQLRQGIPKKGGDVSKILNYVNIKESKTLFLCWLVSCFVPNIPHAAVIIHGEKGAAKSTASGLLKSLIDPSALDTLTLQNDQRTMAVNLQNHWFLPFDNVSYINEETSDTLCRAITGGGIQQRRLNTNAEDAIFIFQRCIAVNGIQNVAKRADLLDRSILIELLRIKDENRKALTEITASFEADKAEILGGVFDTLSKAIGIYPGIKLRNLPRMADFARWGYAIGEALGGMGQTFLDEYAANRQIQNEEAIAGDPVATLIVEFMRDRACWSGKCSELYNKLLFIAADHGISTSDKYYPKNAIVLAKRFSDIKSNLESIGLFIEKVMPRKEDGQHYSIKRAKSSTSSTALQEPLHNAGSGAVDKAAGAVEDAANTAAPTAFTAPSTAGKPAVYAETVDAVDDADDILPFGGSWADVSGGGIPPGFPKPAPPLHGQLKL